MLKNISTDKKVAAILIANDCSDSEIGEATGQLREKGLDIMTIGLSTRKVISQTGKKIVPDISLHYLDQNQSISVLVIPGSKKAVAQMMVDPRVHHLIKRIDVAGGQLIASQTAVFHLEAFKIIDSFYPTRYQLLSPSASPHSDISSNNPQLAS